MEPSCPTICRRTNRRRCSNLSPTNLLLLRTPLEYVQWTSTPALTKIWSQIETWNIDRYSTHTLSDTQLVEHSCYLRKSWVIHTMMPYHAPPPMLHLAASGHGQPHPQSQIVVEIPVNPYQRVQQIVQGESAGWMMAISPSVLSHNSLKSIYRDFSHRSPFTTNASVRGNFAIPFSRWYLHSRLWDWHGSRPCTLLATWVPWYDFEFRLSYQR